MPNNKPYKDANMSFLFFSSSGHNRETEATVAEICEWLKINRDINLDASAVRENFKKNRRQFKELPGDKWTLNPNWAKESKIEDTIVEIIQEHRGSVEIRDLDNGKNIYDEIADRMGISPEERRRLTRGTEKSVDKAWRAQVGYARKRLVDWGDIEPTNVSGWGVWKLTINKTRI
ncbi:MAG: winged helix-turn-helix domain-containing protein [Candidatus Staskawiczbacteria bacterium]|nr:winged helix-turn-helix domain-containing protein [Candidatus Staskawiczbacteria bacterium]